MRQLIHNGVLFPKRYAGKGLHIVVKGERMRLNPEQEEMAVAWVKKLGTEYVNDRVFARNFFKDFGKALGIKGGLSPEDVDFSEVMTYIERERQLKLSLSKAERKQLAYERKMMRELNRERYGYATVDGAKVEIANYTVEPPSIFMGRGKHPLRGRWKPPVNEGDIILNLSPDAPIPPGGWKQIVWQPDSMWIAKWDDKLRGKEKYVWLSDSFHGKQQKDIEKFNKAWELTKRIDDVRRHIMSNLDSEDVVRRKVATVCYLIDALSLRVGDEKDKDEADTVGAITLRPSHVSIGSDGRAVFDFLGKDSVRWRKEIVLPGPVVDNMREFLKEARSAIFGGIRSNHVTLFLSEAMPGLTAKVFRTHHASKVVKDFLAQQEVSSSDPIYLKKHVATIANLGAAIICNHKRKRRKNWQESYEKKKERLKMLRSRAKTEKQKARVRALRIKLKEMKATRDYNLRTSLKSYIDPRLYSSWGKKVDYDWKLYYPKALQKKFSWVETETQGLE